MKNIASVILILVMAIINFFNGFSDIPADLEKISADDVELNESEKALLSDIFETETAWIVSLQLENGAIPMTASKNGEVSVNPYFSDIAALALLDNCDKYSENVRAYMNWHFTHLNTAKDDYNGIDGTIYDYIITLENGVIVNEASKGSYDSTDSYAATFLAVLEKYYEKTDDSDYILSNSSDILRVFDAMFASFDRGLTYAKPDYQVKYLMDNCEVYRGMLAATTLLGVMEDSCNVRIAMKKCASASQWLERQLEKKLWNSEENYYESGIFRNNKPISEFSHTEFYPDATSQLFPVYHGVISADTYRAKALYEAFCENFSWETLDIPSEFPWGAIVYTAALMGDSHRVITYMQSYSSEYMETHSYPLYNADAARVSMAAYILLNS